MLKVHFGDVEKRDQRATGRVMWRYPFAEIPGSVAYGVASSPAVSRGLVFFGGLDGTFYAFRADG
jgi:outer membrane protein assembly factor BamB